MSRVSRSVLALLLLGATQFAFAANNPFEPSSRPAGGPNPSAGSAPGVPGMQQGQPLMGPNGLPLPGVPGQLGQPPVVAKPVDLDAIPMEKLLGTRIGTVNGKSVYRQDSKYFFDKTGKVLSKTDREAALQAHGLPADTSPGASTTPAPGAPVAPVPVPPKPKAN